MRRPSLALVAALVGAMTATGFWAPAPAATTTISTSTPCGVAPATAAPATYSHVELIMFENKPLNRIVGNTTDAPYLNSLIKACSYSKNDRSLSTTSLANYVALTSGYTGCTAIDVNAVCTQPVPITSNSTPATWPQASRSIFELMGGNAIEWNESMPSNCSMTATSDFVINHAPYRYYTRTRATLCPLYDRPLPSTPATTLSAQFSLVIPNKTDIMHLVSNTTVSQRIRNGDNWAQLFVPALLSSPEYQSGNTAILITWDEGNNTQFLVPLIVITPYTQVGGVSSVSYNHYSVLKGIQEMVGVAPLLGHAADAQTTSIRDDPLFGLRP